MEGWTTSHENYPSQSNSPPSPVAQCPTSSGPSASPDHGSPTPEASVGGRPARQTREPPRDENGRLYCPHSDCASIRPTFARRCEWNKHYDRHERPYHCLERSCSKLRGFTYSGGLLRHEREVHGKHGKQSIPCPHMSCKRSSGVGFTRYQNLNEHLRRCHSRPEMEAREPSTVDGSTTFDKGRAKQRWSRGSRVLDEEDSRSPRLRKPPSDVDRQTNQEGLLALVDHLMGDLEVMKRELRAQGDAIERLSTRATNEALMNLDWIQYRGTMSGGER